MKNTHSIKIPGYVSGWTYKYFHQSAYEPPWNFPNKKVITFLFQFKRKEKIKLFRGINKYNKDTSYIVSWTYDKEIALNYIEDGGKIIEKNFYSNDILLDTTVLNNEQKILLGYDYKIDDKEVLIIENNN
ncbi:MAG: hypothetical protein Q8N37_04380 [bacterium]|nr:hypothetical protein [bacterium]